MEESIQFAKKYLEDLLSFFGLNTDVYATNSDDEVIELHVPSTHLNGFLIGQHGDTMRALQFMTMNALKSAGHEVVRVNVDIAEYKKQRADRLSEKTEEWVAIVKESGKAMPLKPMNAADRRTVHKVATDNGLETESVGEGRDRHVVLKPVGDGGIAPKPEVEPEIETEPTSAPEEAEA
jgi:spoIIIJ-associated protein